MKTIITSLLILAICVLILAICASCSKPELCLNGKAHQWGKWEDDSKWKNELGYTPQHRYCTNCNLFESEMHK